MELLEDLRLPFGRDADPGVDDVDSDVVAPASGPNQNVSPRRIAQGVFDQIAKRAIEQRRVGGGMKARLD